MIISKHACILDRAARASQAVVKVMVTDDCNGCRVCLTRFECPALVLNEETGKVYVDQVRCIDCGVCIQVCPLGAIVPEDEG